MVYRVLAHAHVSCSRVQAAVANLHTDVDLCVLLRLIAFQAAHFFLYISWFLLPCAMNHSDVDVFCIIFVSPNNEKKKLYFQHYFSPVINCWFP